MTIKNTLTITSNAKNLKTARSFIEKAAQQSGFKENDINLIVLAVDEACANIIKHAYKESPQKKIIILTKDDTDKLIITLQDFGKKPDLEQIKNIPKEKVRCQGFGLVFINKIMDEVQYDLSPKEGTILKLVRYKKCPQKN